MKVSGALIEAIVSLLRGIGLLEDPKEEVDVRRQLADLEKAKAEVWVDFVRATTPNAERVYMWANSVIALVRPAISALIVGGMVFAPSRILELVRMFGEAGPAGWIILSPVLWWFAGRDVNKVLAMHYGGLIAVGSGAAEPQAPIRPDLERSRGESADRWERIDRLVEELNGSGAPDALEPELDRPTDR